MHVLVCDCPVPVSVHLLAHLCVYSWPQSHGMQATCQLCSMLGTRIFQLMYLRDEVHTTNSSTAYIAAHLEAWSTYTQSLRDKPVYIVASLKTCKIVQWFVNSYICIGLVPGQCTFTCTILMWMFYTLISTCIQLASEPCYASNLPALQYARDESLAANVFKRLSTHLKF